jgi:hypothetical protein
VSGGIWGDVPLTEESGRYPTPPEQSLAAGLVKGMWAPVDYVGRVARGQSAVFDPETGHVGDEAIKWAADQAINRGPSRVPVSPGEVALGAGPIKAYHGSPHDFDRFDMSKIGSGEGAQAYGHGLYFAENEGVARSYRDALAPRSAYAPNTPEDLAHFIWTESKARDPKQASQFLDRYISDPAVGGWDIPPSPSDLKEFAAARSLIVSGRVPPPNPGRMYEVAIHADPERFLDWDKPLSAQPQVRETAKFTPEQVDSLVSPLNRSFFPAGEYEALRMDPPGHYLWKSAVRSSGSPASATEKLREAGVPGIRYLDGGSRAAGDGSRNFVTFDDKLVEILRKYGILGPAALGAGSAAMTMPQGTDQ